MRLAEMFGRIHEPWSPKIVAELNGQHVKLVKFHGEFIWHRHEAEDEMFLVIAGRLRIDLRELPSLDLGPGEMAVIPRGLLHRPVAVDGADVLLFEPKFTRNTGDSFNERTVRNEWLCDGQE